MPVIDPLGERLVLASPEGVVVSLAGRRTVAARLPVPQPPVPNPPSEPAATDDAPEEPTVDDDGDTPADSL